MSAGDNTRDYRWMPGSPASERRVREELSAPEQQTVISRELSFVPTNRRAAFKAHDDQGHVGISGVTSA